MIQLESGASIPCMLFRPIKYDHTDKFGSSVAGEQRRIKIQAQHNFAPAFCKSQICSAKVATKEEQTSRIKLIAAQNASPSQWMLLMLLSRSMSA